MTESEDPGLDFSGLSPEDLEKAFSGLPEEEKATKLVEMLHDDLVDVKRVSDFLQSVTRYTEIAIRVLTTIA